MKRTRHDAPAADLDPRHLQATSGGLGTLAIIGIGLGIGVAVSACHAELSRRVDDAYGISGR